MTPRDTLTQKGPETIRAWVTHGFAAKHLTRPDPEKDKARAAGVLLALVTSYGDLFVARQIGDYAAWCASHPHRIAGRIRHDDAVRKWAQREAEKFAAQQPGARPQKPDLGTPQRASQDRYRCGKCGREGRTDYLTFARHHDACQAVPAPPESCRNAG